MSKLVKSTLLVTLLNGLGIILGLFSNIFIAVKFGVGKEMDVYVAISSLPLYISSILNGALSTTFIPVFVEYKHHDKEEVWRLVSSLINIGFLITVVIVILVEIFSKQIMSVLTPGFSPDKIIIAAQFLRWQILIIIFVVINELMSGVYYAKGYFAVPFLNKIVSPLITIFYVLCFSRLLNVKSLIFASLTAMFVQTLILSFGFIKRKDFFYTLSFDFFNPAIVKMSKLMLPIVLGMVFYRIIPIFDSFFVSSLPEGGLSYIGYSFKLYNQFPSFFSIGISIAIFPLMANLVVEKSWEILKKNMSIAIRMLLFISLPITIILGIYSREVIEILFVRGAFLEQDAINTARAFSLYLLALPMAMVGGIIARGYYMFQDTITPTLIGIVEIILYVVCAYLFLPHLGYLAIPCAYAVYMNFSAINVLFVRRKLKSKGGRTIIICFLKHAFIAAVSSLIVFFPMQYVACIFIRGIIIAISFILYFAISLVIAKTQEAQCFWNVFVNKFRFSREL